MTHFLITLLLASIPTWTTQQSNVTHRLRGISAVNVRVIWASGAGSTVLRTMNGGETWQRLQVTTDQLDFRDIDASDENTAYILSIGNGSASRIYKTTDAGATWTLQFKNEDEKVFLDAMSFWDPNNGIVVGDSVNGQLFVMTTNDGGAEWKRVPPASLPPALPNEGAFAASGTNIAVVGKTHAWIGLGAANKARVLLTTDRGRTWKIVETPIKSGQSSGIFSVAFRDTKHGVVVGGDYTKETEASDNLALTNDGGLTWKLATGLSGFRSAVAYVPVRGVPGSKTLVAIGPSGSDLSTDDGLTWQPIEGPGFDTLSFASKNLAWASGVRGTIGQLSLGTE